MVINCVGGFGDVLFCEPIYRKFWNESGKKPNVIIHDHQMHLQEYIDSAVFVKASEHKDLKDCFEINANYVPLRYANQQHRLLSPHDHSDIENMMLDKYRLLGLDENLWKTIKLNFNHKKGEDLAQLLNVSLYDEYTLRNVHSQIGDIVIVLNKNKTVIDMKPIAGFSMIDWFLLHKQADGIHTVSTSTFFMMQALCNKGWCSPEVYVYPRPNEDGLRGISQLEPDFQIIRMK